MCAFARVCVYERESQAHVHFLTHRHTHTHPHTFRAFIICGKVALHLNAAVLTSVACTAFRAVVIARIERVPGASLAFCNVTSIRVGGDEFLARSALGD